MRIGVLGTGMVGRAISGKLAELGHDVRVGSRTAGEGKVEFADAAAMARWSSTARRARRRSTP